MENRKKKEIIIDLAGIEYLYPFYKLLIQKLQLPIITGLNPDALSDFLREPWEEDRYVRFVGVSKINTDIRTELPIIEKMFKRVKTFQAKCGNEFIWSKEA